jgi:hypothetical protein
MDRKEFKLFREKLEKTQKQMAALPKNKCPAWEFQAGKYCRLINGNICEGSVQEIWGEKMKICRSCEVFSSLLQL